jgi:aminocarboxymuconate-semialdehyde decarboxylase
VTTPAAGQTTRGAVVDVHAHWMPDSALDAFRAGTSWYGSETSLNAAGFPTMVTAGRRSTVGSLRHFDGIAGRLADMDAAGIDVQVLSVLPPFFRYGIDDAAAIESARAINREMAAVVAAHPTRFRAWGHVALQAEPADVARQLDEIARMDGFAGVAIGTHVAGMPLGDDGLAGFWEEVEARRLAIFLHPPAGDRRALDLPAGFFLDNVIGNPVETTLALASLVLTGTLERRPGLRLVAAHGGGYFVAALGRLRHAAEARSEPARLLAAGFTAAAYAGLHVDSITHSAAALRFLVDELGPDRVLLGTDYPSDMSEEDPVSFVNEALADHPAETRAAVLGMTAAHDFLGSEMGR